MQENFKRFLEKTEDLLQFLVVHCFLEDPWVQLVPEKDKKKNESFSETAKARDYEEKTNLHPFDKLRPF